MQTLAIQKILLSNHVDAFISNLQIDNLKILSAGIPYQTNIRTCYIE